MNSTTRSLVPCLHGTKVGEEFGPLDLIAREFRSRRYCYTSAMTPTVSSARLNKADGRTVWVLCAGIRQN
jgi:hypothetical protein